MRELLESGRATINARDENGLTPITAAITWKRHILAAWLCQQPGRDVNIVDNNGDSPLHICPDIFGAALLLKHGASLTTKNEEGQDPLNCVFAEVQMLTKEIGTANYVEEEDEHEAECNLAEKQALKDFLVTAQVDFKRKANKERGIVHTQEEEKMHLSDGDEEEDEEEDEKKVENKKESNRKRGKEDFKEDCLAVEGNTQGGGAKKKKKKKKGKKAPSSVASEATQ